jgi:hypothetical protein
MCFKGVFCFKKFYDILHKGENCICILMSILCSLLIYTPMFYLPILLVLIMTIISFKKKLTVIKLSLILKDKALT